MKVERGISCKPDLDSNLPICQCGNSVLCTEAQNGEINDHHRASPLEAGIHDSHACEVPIGQLNADGGTQVEISGKECSIVDCSSAKGDMGDFGPSDKAAAIDDALLKSLKLANPVNMMSLDKDQMGKVGMHCTLSSAKHSTSQRQPTKSFSKQKAMDKSALHPQPRVPLELLQYNEVVNSSKQPDQCKSGQKLDSMKQKIKQSRDRNMHAKENMVDSISMPPKNQLEKKPLPHFESFILEEEEGSGGYGTVYRAWRKNDGKRYAIKCPHDNAQKHHVSNELKMLERFGSRNFIIRYESSFRRGNSECFVLEHVEHDRPEDLQQKYATGSKSKSSYSVSVDHIPLPHSISAPSTRDQKPLKGKSVLVNLRKNVDSKQAFEPKNMKKRVDAGLLNVYPDLGGRCIFGSQGADGSGITSTKDATSTRTPSTERLREPLPCIGRKELISLVQDTMQSPNHDSTNIPASQRKRIAAAPPGKVDRKFVYLSPMPLHSDGIAVGGAGLLKGKGDGKHKKEGPCVGTKGFRAPEVLFRSLYQGSKVDIWSAGVTLLYLMIGRTHFVGDPEQNIKEIAKLRGSEDLWEVAKLHDRESSFPVELFDAHHLPSMELQTWCKINTETRFLEAHP